MLQVGPKKKKKNTKKNLKITERTRETISTGLNLKVLVFVKTTGITRREHQPQR